MRCIAYVTAGGPSEDKEIVEVTPLTPLPVQVDGFTQVLSQGREVVAVSAEWLEGNELPGYFELDLEDDMVGVLTRLELTPTSLLRGKGANALLVGDPGVEVTSMDTRSPGFPLPESWRDRLLQRKPELAAVEASGHRRLLIWIGPTSYEQWYDGCRRRDAQRSEEIKEGKARAARLEQDQLITAGTNFVNPYTFVPLPASVYKTAPNGHAQAIAGGLTGYIDAAFHLQTPMMLANDFQPEADGGSERQQAVRVPGSAVRGAVRSLYEVMTESCLSVIDPDYRPVHRATIQVDPEACLAVVTRMAPDGSSTHVRTTSEVIWIPAKLLHSHFASPAGLRSGQRIRFDETKASVRPFGKVAGRDVTRNELEEAGADSITLADGELASGDWVVHVADAGTKGLHPVGRIFVAAGKLDATDIPLAVGAWDDYRERCRGSQDVQQGQLASGAPAWSDSAWSGVPVEHVHTPKGGRKQRNIIGTRRKSDGALGEGDSVWVTPAADGATGLKVSASWRVWGKMPVHDRLPDKSLLPCTNPDALCPACALFGFIEQRRVTRQRPGKTEQNAYASHVRFPAFFETDGPVGIREIHPPPLRSPRPSAGSFYLAHPQAQPPLWESGKARLGQPTSHWGADDTPVRKIAGRKFYWHGQEPWDSDPTPRQRRRDHYPAPGDPKNKDAKRWLMDAGNTLTGRIHFENITRDQFAFLLMALDPRRLRDLDTNDTATEELQTHLGGGKPLGFGSATVTLMHVAVEDAAGRYRETADAVDSEELMELKAPVPPDAPWLPGLVKALTSEAVPANRIWYPTMGNFNSRSEDQQEAFDESYAFYAAFSGANKRKGASGANRSAPRPVSRMRTLPRIDAPSQFMTNEYPQEN